MHEAGVSGVRNDVVMNDWRVMVGTALLWTALALLVSVPASTRGTTTIVVAAFGFGTFAAGVALIVEALKRNITGAPRREPPSTCMTPQAAMGGRRGREPAAHRRVADREVLKSCSRVDRPGPKPHSELPRPHVEHEAPRNEPDDEGAVPSEQRGRSGEAERGVGRANPP